MPDGTDEGEHCVSTSVMRISSVGLTVVLTGCSGATPFGDELVGPTSAPNPSRLSAVAPPDGSSTVAVSTQFVRATEDGHGLVIRVDYPDLCQELLGVHVDERQTSVRVVAVATRQAGRVSSACAGWRG